MSRLISGKYELEQNKATPIISEASHEISQLPCSWHENPRCTTDVNTKLLLGLHDFTTLSVQAGQYLKT